MTIKIRQPLAHVFGGILKGEIHHETGEITFTDRNLAEALGYKDHSFVSRLMKRHAEPLAELGELLVTLTKNPKGGRPIKTTALNLRHVIYLASRSDTDEGKAVSIYLAETFAKIEQGEIATSNYDRAQVEDSGLKAAAWLARQKEHVGTAQDIAKDFAKAAHVERQKMKLAEEAEESLPPWDV